MRNRTVPYFIASMLVTLVGLPVWAADNASDEQTLRDAATVLHAMLDSKDVPASVVAKADCIIILPSVKKFAIGIGGTGGRGPMSCRGGKNFSGKFGTRYVHHWWRQRRFSDWGHGYRFRSPYHGA